MFFFEKIVHVLIGFYQIIKNSSYVMYIKNSSCVMYIIKLAVVRIHGKHVYFS